MPIKTKNIDLPQETKRQVSAKFTVRLIGAVADLGPERVFILTEGNIKDILRDLDKKHPGNKGLVAFLRLMEEEMFTEQKEA